MRVIAMKSRHFEGSRLLGTTTMPYEPVSEDLKERVETDLVLSAGVAAILAVCVAMFVGVYCWSQYAPLFSTSGADVPAIQETIPWSG
jgi:hypothetical protein